MSNDPAVSEAASLQALAQGDDRALDQLIARWQQPLFAFAWRYVHNSADAQDLVAETFVRLYRQRERLRPDTRLSAWLFTTLTNLCHNQHRWRRRHPSVSLEETGETGAAPPRDTLAGAGPGPGETLEAHERRHVLLASLDDLPPDMKSALLLHYFEHLSYADIAAVLGGSERGIETKIYRAKQRLRAKLVPLLTSDRPQRPTPAAAVRL